MGFEPMTSAVTGQHSRPLSYLGRICLEPWINSRRFSGGAAGVRSRVLMAVSDSIGYNHSLFECPYISASMSQPVRHPITLGELYVPTFVSRCRLNYG